MKNNLTHRSQTIAGEPLSSQHALALADKQLQENKLFIQFLLDENKNLKKELQALKKNCVELKLEQQKLLDNISHEIKTPLQAIMGLSNTLNEAVDEATRNEHIKIIENAAFVLGAVITNILDVSRISAKNIKLKTKVFQPRILLENLETTFLYRLKNKPVEFKISIDKDIPAWLEGDEQKILHVLFTLLNNAEKYTESGFIKLSAAVLKHTPDKILTGFTVEDTGKGIDPSNPDSSLSRLEDLLEQKTRIDREGKGFGLPVTKSLLKLLKGDIKIENSDITDPMDGGISVESKGNKGIKITIAIPLKISTQKEHTATITDGNENLLSLLNVLVAEDDDVNKKILSILFNKWNVQYTAVGNGREAIEQIAVNDFDLMLMDVRMPVLDGLEATQIIRNMEVKSKSSIPIIGISASMLIEYELKGKTAGMTSFLPKPFKPEQLKELLLQYAMKKQTITEQFLNTNTLNDFFGNDYKAAAEIFKVFIEEKIPEINTWGSLLDTKGIQALGARAHALKPVLEMIGLDAVSARCFELEKACKNNLDISKLKEEIDSIQKQVNDAAFIINEQYKLIIKKGNRND